MIDGVTNADSLPVLERLMQFAGQRHRLIADNIANLDTPRFLPTDLSVSGFQGQLAEAIDARRAEHGARGGELRVRDSQELRFGEGSIDVQPTPLHENVLFHDDNDRNLERTMQSLVENFMTFRMAAQMMRSRFDLINTAIRERI